MRRDQFSPLQAPAVYNLWQDLNSETRNSKTYFSLQNLLLSPSSNASALALAATVEHGPDRTGGQRGWAWVSDLFNVSRILCLHPWVRLTMAIDSMIFKLARKNMLKNTSTHPQWRVSSLIETRRPPIRHLSTRDNVASCAETAGTASSKSTSMDTVASAQTASHGKEAMRALNCSLQDATLVSHSRDTMSTLGHSRDHIEIPRQE